MRLLPQLADEDELDQPTESIEVPKASPLPRRGLGVVAGSLITRLGYLFFCSDPKNAGDGFTDAYHHWQIAYLTKEIGLTHGPRLWDMRGWEYVWGRLRPLFSFLLPARRLPLRAAPAGRRAASAVLACRHQNSIAADLAARSGQLVSP